MSVVLNVAQIKRVDIIFGFRKNIDMTTQIRDAIWNYRVWLTQLLIITVTRYDSRARSLEHYEESRFHTSVHYARIHWSNIGTIMCNPESVLATAVMALWFQHTTFPSPRIPPHSARPRLRRAANSAHPFPAIFGNFHPFMRPNNTGQPERAAIWKGNFAFSLGKSPYGESEKWWFYFTPQGYTYPSWYAV